MQKIEQTSKDTLVQTRVTARTKKKLERLADATDRKLASYIRLVLEAHVKEIDPRTIRQMKKIWAGVKDKNAIVRAEDGPR